MNNLKQHTRARQLRRQRVRSTIYGTSTRPRLTVHISNRQVSAQIIDDNRQITLAQVSSESKPAAAGTLAAKAAWVGSEIAKEAKTAKVSKVVFDRNSRIYHGRVKALAEAARTGGLEF